MKERRLNQYRYIKLTDEQRLFLHSLESVRRALLRAGGKYELNKI